MCKYAFILLILSVSHLVEAQNVVPDNIERQALMDLYNSTDGANWSLSSRWRVTQIQSYPDSIPYGVEVENGDITAISLGYSGLNGSLPSSLADLTQMRYLMMHWNDLTGSLPDLSPMQELLTLDVGANDFSGSFPDWVTDITTLTSLDLSSDLATPTVSFSGPIPSEISQLINLETFTYNGNDLSMKDAVPASLSDCDNWEILYLGSCQLTDSSFVTGITGMQSLTNLDLSNNPNMQVNGTMSDVIYDQPSLKQLYLPSNNYLKLSPSFNELNITFLGLAYNSIYGSTDVLATLVDTLSLLPHLSTLALSSCNIDSLPSNMELLESVQALSLSSNPNLIPDQCNVLSKMPNLKNLTMVSCSLTDLPDSLVQCEKLEVLHLDHNQLYPIPELIKDIPVLKQLQMTGNGIMELPAWFGSESMDSLQVLNLSGNLIPSPLPDNFGNMKQLQKLYLNSNKLDGGLQLVFESLTSLDYLNLSYNNLDSISADLTTLTKLRVVYLDHNELKDVLPKILPLNVPPVSSPILDISFNQLDGFTPHDMGTGFRLSVGNNYMTFADVLQQSLPIASYSYSPQALVDSARTMVGYIGETISLVAAVDTLDSLGCEFQWVKVKDGAIITTYPKSTLNDVFQVQLDSMDTGVEFYYRITNTQVPQLTLTSRPISLVLLSASDLLVDFERNHYVLVGDTLVLTTYIHRATPSDTIAYLYQWYEYVDGENDIPIIATPSEDGHTYVISGIQQSDFGKKYYYKIINPNNPNDVRTSHYQTIVQGSATCTSTLEEEYQALMALYHTTNGDEWINNTGWRDADPNVVQPLTGWYGVRTNGQGRVIYLDLDGVPNFTFQHLNGWPHFPGNNLTGFITPELRKLCSLSRLILGGNKLEGTIPNELLELKELTQLILAENQLVGEIPRNIGVLTKVAYLFINSNHLSGSIPPSMGGMSSMFSLDLYDNHLSGPIPPELSELKAMGYLHIHQNELTGPIPPELGDMTGVGHVELNNNKLTGPIPPEITKPNNLSWLQLANNELTGTIPAELTNKNNLVIVNVSNNKLTEEIPLSILDNPKLDSLYVNRNGFTFSDLLPVKNRIDDDIYYGIAPQDSVDVKKIVAPLFGKARFTTSIDRETDAPSLYQWFQYVEGGDDIPITQEPSRGGHTFVVENNNAYPEGTKFYYKITNPDAPELTLVSRLQTFMLSCVPPPPVLSFTTEDNFCALKFIPKKNYTGFCTTLSYTWDFGDGTTSTEMSPLHFYGQDGSYNASLTIHYECGSCQDTATVTQQLTFNSNAGAKEDSLIEITTERKEQIINSSASTFTDSWPLLHEQELASKNPFINGSGGVWRNESSYAYQVARDRSIDTDIAKDGTYTMDQFSWQYADLELIPDWIKANTMTLYSPFSYELENRDVLGIYSAALYDYGGHLPSATGVNMKNEEMAFTSFEYLNGFATGNWVFGSQPGPTQREYHISYSRGHKIQVWASLSELMDVEQMQLVVKNGFLKEKIFNVNVVCMVPDPDRPDRTIVIVDKPVDLIINGKAVIQNEVEPSLTPELGAMAHTGISALEITAPTTFKQEMLHLESGKTYWISAWVAVENPDVVAPKLADNLGFDVVIRNSDDQLIDTKSILPVGRIIEGWQQVKGSFSVPDGAHIELTFKPGSTGTAWYDDLRLHPEKGNMKSYVYNLTDYRLQAILDEENFASFFYYDAEGNLYLTKKETEKGIKTLTENVSYQRESGEN